MYVPLFLKGMSPFSNNRTLETPFSSVYPYAGGRGYGDYLVRNPGLSLEYVPEKPV